MGRCEGKGEGGSGGGLARLVAFLSLFTQPFLVTRGRETAALGSRWLLTSCTTTGPFVEELHEELIYTCESRNWGLTETKAKEKQTLRPFTSLCSVQIKESVRPLFDAQFCCSAAALLLLCCCFQTRANHLFFIF